MRRCALLPILPLSPSIGFLVSSFLRRRAPSVTLLSRLVVFSFLRGSALPPSLLLSFSLRFFKPSRMFPLHVFSDIIIIFFEKMI